jgi:hypothetical protein
MLPHLAAPRRISDIASLIPPVINNECRDAFSYLFFGKNAKTHCRA